MSNDPEVAALKATIKAQGIEIRDLKAAHAQALKVNADAMGDLSEKLEALTLQMQPLLLATPKLTALLDEAERQKGMAQLGKLLVGGGAFTFIGAAALGIYNYFIGGGPQ
jgi:hypothetical protein